MLAKAGGLYHDVGKMISKNNYIDEGLAIADEYFFPKELKAILKEHNIKSEKPGSVEAAIVMLSDSVVSTIEYIEKNDDRRYTTNKIIENIFQLRMEKGSFDASTISLKDYKLLKEFYQREFENKGQAS
jgi:membrane-associated HD superfamily phosphohydrolase